MNASGPDQPQDQCRVPDGCCGPTPCDVTLENFICQIRALLPEGQVYNNVLEATPRERPLGALGAITVCDNLIGTDQLIIGGCCGDDILCDDDPPLPQLALIDSFSAVAYGAVQALCTMLRELNPCTAQLTVHEWARRYGIDYPDPCDGQWSDQVLSLLICLLLRLRFEVRNWDFFVQLGAFFGADMLVRYAGQFDCPGEHPSGWWTMARDGDQCPAIAPCPPQELPPRARLMRLVPTCQGPQLSLNIVMWPRDNRIVPGNCNLPAVASPQPFDPELYEVWKWLLPQLLPPGPYYCVYERDEANCIM
jgi:hypothetical protein